MDNYLLFTFVETRRHPYKYPYKILNEKNVTFKKTIHFIHRYITDNAGDKACGYYNYFLTQFVGYRCVVHDINHVHFSMIKKDDIVIIGGGGLLNALTEWNYTINKVVDLAGKSIIWSAGFNMESKNKIDVKINWNKINIIAIRDFNHNSGFRYIPCATCMLPELNYSYPIKRKIGVILHHQLKDKLPDEMKPYEAISNAFPLQEIIQFIGSSEIILTSSYHAAYWSLLMQKKCIVFSMHSEKFNYLRYSPVFYSGNLLLDINQVRSYPNVLTESRHLTLEYVKDIMNIIRS